jgi:hypothetical protein
MKALASKMSMRGPDGKKYPVLGGSCADLITHQADMVSLKQPEHNDRLTTYVQERFGFLFRVSI